MWFFDFGALVSLIVIFFLPLEQVFVGKERAAAQPAAAQATRC